MTVTDSSPIEIADIEIQALFEEARRRRRKRWILGIVTLIMAALAVALIAVFGASNPHRRVQMHVGLPKWMPPAGTAHSAPPIYVAGDGKGGIGVYSTTTGSLIRTLSPEGTGGPDQQAVLSRNRKSVFFVQPTGACSGNILRGPVSGVSAPVAVVSNPHMLALTPSPSPTSNELAWVGRTCEPNGSTSTSSLYVTNLATGAQRELGDFTGQHGDDEISWSPDGSRIAIESGLSVAVVRADQTSLSQAKILRISGDCTLESPAFLPRQNQLAVIRTCYGTDGQFGRSQALVFDVTSGKAVALLATAPNGSTFQGLSADTSGNHILLGVVSSYPAGARNVEVENGRLVTINTHALTDAEW